MALCSFAIYTCCIAATLLLASAQQFVSHKDCNNLAKGTIIANPANCSQYILCNGLRSTLGECPAGSYFNPAVLSCDNKKSVCGKKNQTTTITPTTADVGGAPSEAVNESAMLRPNSEKIPTIDVGAQGSFGRPLCTVWYDRKFPNPHSCKHYFHCISGFLTVRRCNFGFGWDVDSQKCVPKQLANCFRANRRH